MPDHPRWRIPAGIATLINAELTAARTSNHPWLLLERAHLLSQPWRGATPVFTELGGHWTDDEWREFVAARTRCQGGSIS